MKRFIFASLSLLLISSFAFAQMQEIKDEKSVCPTIEIVSPITYRIESLDFSVSIPDNFNTSNLKYKWSTNLDVTIYGQGKSAISILSFDLENKTVIAKVEIEGLPKGCQNIFEKEGRVVSSCPKIDINTSESTSNSGKLVKVMAMINGNIEDYEIDYVWNTNSSEIVDGQGTNTAFILTGKERIQRGEVKINGFPKGCINRKSYSIECSDCERPNSILFKEFGKINKEDFKQEMDLFMTEMQNNPDAEGYVINYGLRADVTERESLFRDYLRYWDFYTSRIVFVNGGIEKEIRTRLWIVPLDADSSDID